VTYLQVQTDIIHLIVYTSPIHHSGHTLTMSRMSLQPIYSAYRKERVYNLIEYSWKSCRHTIVNTCNKVFTDHTSDGL